MNDIQRFAIRNAAIRFRKHATSIVVGWNKECCILLHPRCTYTPIPVDPYPQQYSSHLVLQFTDARNNTTTISVLGCSHDGVARLATWLWSWPSQHSNDSLQRIHIHRLTFDFAAISFDSLKQLLSNCPCVRFTDCRIKVEQAAVIACNIAKDTNITFCDCVFIDGGSTFLDALSCRKHTGGTLEIQSREGAEANTPHDSIMEDRSMRRLLKNNFRLECLKITSNLFRNKDPGMLLLPFRARAARKVEYTVYHSDDGRLRNSNESATLDTIVPPEFHLIVQDSKAPSQETPLDGVGWRRRGTIAQDTTDMILPHMFLRACRHSTPLKKMGFSYHRPGTSVPVRAPHSIQASLCYAVHGNLQLQELMLDCGCTYDWKTLFESIKDVTLQNHCGIRTLTFVVHQKSDNSLVPSLLSFLQRNRHLEVQLVKAVHCGFTALVWEHQIRSLVQFNRYFRASLAWCRLESFDLRFSAWEMALCNSQRHLTPIDPASSFSSKNDSSIRKMALLLHHHTDLLCIFVKEMRLVE